jgi:hypothetical protein
MSISFPIPSLNGFLYCQMFESFQKFKAAIYQNAVLDKGFNIRFAISSLISKECTYQISARWLLRDGKKTGDIISKLGLLKNYTTLSHYHGQPILRL